MAGGADIGGDDELISGINVTPLVDVVLVLLVILMVTATYLAKQDEEIPVELPETQNGAEAPDDEPTELVITIAGDGADQKVYLDGTEITLAALGERAREARAEDERTRAILRADQAVPHGIVVRVIDTLRGANVLKFAFNVSPEALEEEAEGGSE